MKRLWIICLLCVFCIEAAVAQNEVETEQAAAYVFTKEELFTNIFLKKGQQVIFKVSGGWTMWGGVWGDVDHQGHKNYKKVNELGYLGALVGRVGASDNFLVEDDMTFVSPETGRLVLYANKGTFQDMGSQGSMEVIIVGARERSAMEIDQMFGWDYSKINTATVNAAFMSEQEKEMLILMNKARTNPALFAEQYIAHRVYQGDHVKECFEYMKSAEASEALVPTGELHGVAVLHATEMGETGVVKYADGLYAQNVSVGLKEPEDMLVSMLIDKISSITKGHRKNVMSKDYKHVGIAIGAHVSQGHCGVIIFQ